MRDELVFVAVFVVGACVTTPAPVPPPVVVDGHECDAAQVRLEQLGCAWAKSPKGVPFGKACRDVAAGGIDLAPRCIAAASTCEEARRCRP